MPLHQTRGIFSIVFSTLVAGACGGSGRSVPTDSASIPDSGVAPDASSGKFDSGNSDSGASIDAGTCDRCDGRTGLCAATPTCSAANLTAPDCKTHNAARPSFDDGPPRKWTAAGVERAACLFAPVVSKPLPLVIYLHGATGSADAIYDATSLRQKAPSYDLTGES
jgi:S-formylglutathione hydrolase FrmB